MNHAVIRPYFLATLLALVAVFTVYLLQPFLVTVAVAAVFSVVLHPIFIWFTGRARAPRGLAAIATVLVGLVLLAIPLSFVVSRLVIESQGLYATLTQPGSLGAIENGILAVASSLDQAVPGSGDAIASFALSIDTYSQQAASWVLTHAAGALTGTLRFAFLFFVFLMTLFYLLKDGERLRTTVLRLSPLMPAETELLMNRLSRTVASVVRGNLTIALLQGIFVAVGFTIFGIPNAVLWGTIGSIGALIPGIGTSLVLFPGVLYLAFSGATGAALGLAVWGIAIVGLVDNLLGPKLIGGRAAIHPLLILLSVLGGIALFGPEGIFLGPLAMSLLIGLLSIYSPASDDAAAVQQAAKS